MNMQHAIYFSHLFFLHSAFLLSLFYLNANFQGTFAELNTNDIFRSIVVLIIMLVYCLLIGNLNSNFTEAKKSMKFILFAFSFLTAMLAMLFLISI